MYQINYREHGVYLLIQASVNLVELQRSVGLNSLLSAVELNSLKEHEHLKEQHNNWPSSRYGVHHDHGSKWPHEY